MRNATLWYIIQYDVQCPKRGQKLLRFMKTCAIALQKSVFAWQGTATELKELKQQLLQRINPNQDDIRGYIIQKPILIFGSTPFIQDSYYNGNPPHQHCQHHWLNDPPQCLFK